MGNNKYKKKLMQNKIKIKQFLKIMFNNNIKCFLQNNLNYNKLILNIQMRHKKKKNVMNKNKNYFNGQIKK